MRIAFISDVHEDIQNLERVIRKIENTGYDQLICLGDISGFSIPHYKYWKSRNAHDCLSLLREKCTIIIPGNHDLHAAKIIPKLSAVFDYPENWYQLDYHQRLAISENSIWLNEETDLDPLYTFDDIKFLKSLQEFHVLDAEGNKILLSHYVYPNLSGVKKGFYSSHEEFNMHFEFMKRNDCNISFTGHTHIRGIYTVSQFSFTEYLTGKVKLDTLPLCVGILPVTSHKNRSGFCIFDTKKFSVRILKTRNIF